MIGEKKDRGRDDESSGCLSRRHFVALSLAAGLAAATRPASGAGLPVVEADVDVKTPDGTCDAVFIHPAKGSHPGVLVWHDSPGLRPAIRGLGRRIAAEGYSVLVPNLFYRAARAPVFDSSFDYAKNPADRQKYARTVRRRAVRLTALPGGRSVYEVRKRRWQKEGGGSLPPPFSIVATLPALSASARLRRQVPATPRRARSASRRA